MDVCQKCGDKGDLKRLIYCVQCKVSAEHRYCLHVLPKRGENVVWTCEDCTPKNAKLGPVPSRKSGRISHAAEVRLNRMKMQKQSSFRTSKAQNHRLSEAKPSIGDQSFLNKEVKNLPSNDQSLGNEFRKVKRRLVIEDGENSDEESEPIKVEAPQSAPTVCDGPFDVLSCLPSLESDKDVDALPIIDPIWRGCFNINNVKSRTSVRLMAYLSSRACSLARDAATALPPLLNVEILSRSDVWPQRFRKFPLTDGRIGLYFFPESESEEKDFDTLLDDMIEHNLALKAVIHNFKLLVFSSRELPPEIWRFCNKYYLWGVFKTIDYLVQNSGAECVTPFKLANNVGIQHAHKERRGASDVNFQPEATPCASVDAKRCLKLFPLEVDTAGVAKEGRSTKLVIEMGSGFSVREDYRDGSTGYQRLPENHFASPSGKAIF